MNSYEVKDDFAEGALLAMEKAREIAYERAARFGHNVPIWQDGKVVFINPKTGAVAQSAVDEVVNTVIPLTQ